MAQATYRLFSSLDSIIRHYSFVLTQPFASNITEQPWFQGDLNSSETEELLAGEPRGTYLVRFSSAKAGALALSFVLPNGSVRHARVNSACDRSGHEQWYIEGEYSKAQFPSVNDLIAFYVRSGVLRQPFA